MFGKVFSAAVTAVTALLILAGLFYFGAKLYGIRPYIVLSSSMEPVMPSGALAFVNTKDREAETGDIITFEILAEVETPEGVPEDKGNRLTVTHRVADVLEEGILTKGDANERPDPSLVRKEQILGKYLFCIPKMGSLMTGRGRWFFMAGAGVVILLNAGAALISADNKK